MGRAALAMDLTQAQALAVTLAVEVPIVTAAAWSLGRSPARAALAAVIASALTHPLAWHFSTKLGPDDFPAVIAIEAVVCLVEAVVLAAVLRVRAWLALSLAIAANAVSAALGWWL